MGGEVVVAVAVVYFGDWGGLVLVVYVVGGVVDGLAAGVDAV